jgi:putative transposase
MQWLTTTHARRWREHRASRGEGHLYQGRFRSFPVQDDRHFLTLMRYVESNPLRAGKVERAQDWPWSSLRPATGAQGVRVTLGEWPVPRPRDWESRVNEALAPAELDRLRGSVDRGRPFGEGKWLERTVERLGLASTLRAPWRPKGVRERGPRKRRRQGDEPNDRR